MVKTGGTTGTPTTVVHDAWFRDYGRATRLFSQELCRFPLGTRFFRLWGNENELSESEEQLDRRILRALLGEIPMNAFRAKEPELKRHLATIHAHPDIRHMMTYVDAAASLAMFIEDQGLPRPSMETIMACAGTVPVEWRTLLHRAFGAEVFDKYGSRECADIACECSNHQGLHIYSPNVYVEIVDPTGSPCPPGKTGRVLVTLLNNHSFPMIRYEIGDLATAADNDIACPCGLRFPKLANIQGRTDDMLVTEKGTSLTSVFVRHLLGVSMNQHLIKEWQLVQENNKDLILSYVPLSRNGLQANLDRIKTSLQKAIGETCRVVTREVGEIPHPTNGKIRWIINKTSALHGRAPNLNK